TCSAARLSSICSTSLRPGRKLLNKTGPPSPYTRRASPTSVAPAPTSRTISTPSCFSLSRLPPNCTADRLCSTQYPAAAISPPPPSTLQFCPHPPLFQSHREHPPSPASFLHQLPSPYHHP